MYRQGGGYETLKKALTSMKPEDVLQSVKDSGEVPLFDVIRKFQTSAAECCPVSSEVAAIQVADFFLRFNECPANIVVPNKS